MRAVVDDAVEERLRLDALAHEPALHVRDRDDERVDRAVADHALELFEAWVPMVGDGCHRPSPRSLRAGPILGPPGSLEHGVFHPSCAMDHLAVSHLAVIPPSATITEPVTNDDSSEARKSATFAISRGSPGRPIGWNESIVA